MEIKKYLQIAKELSVLIGIAVIGIIILDYTTDIFKTPKVIEKEVVFTSPTSTPIQASEYPDFDAIKDMKKLSLLENFKTYTPNGEFYQNFTDYNIILRTGKIARGYIEFEASINNKPLTSWESLYFKALYDREDHYNYGGHIFRDDSLRVPAGSKTHLLYALNNIPFIANLDYLWLKKPQKLDLFQIINNYKQVNFLTYISSLNPAQIDSIKIYYECDESVDKGVCELDKKEK